MDPSVAANKLKDKISTLVWLANFLNGITFIVGLFTVGYAAVLVYNFSFNAAKTMPVTFTAFITAFTIGSLTLVILLYAIYATVKEHKIHLLVSIIFRLGIFIAGVATIAIIIPQKEKAEEVANDLLINDVKLFIVSSKGDVTDRRTLINEIEPRLNCCGAYNKTEYKPDLQNSKRKQPDCTNRLIHLSGCIEVTLIFVKKYYWLHMSLIITLMILLLMQAVPSFMLTFTVQAKIDVRYEDTQCTSIETIQVLRQERQQKPKIGRRIY